MKSESRHFLLRVVLTLLLATSLLSVAFAHRSIARGDTPEAISTLAALGFTPADLCAGSDDADGGMDMGDCPACRIAGSILLAEPVETFAAIELQTSAAILVPARTHVLGRPTNPATPVRAPPQA